MFLTYPVTDIDPATWDFCLNFSVLLKRHLVESYINFQDCKIYEPYLSDNACLIGNLMPPSPIVSEHDASM